MYNEFGGRRQSLFRKTIEYIWTAIILQILVAIFSPHVIAIFIISWPIKWLWNSCWVPTFTTFHDVGFLATFGILIMMRFIIGAVTK
jgi:hypothetical protein